MDVALRSCQHGTPLRREIAVSHARASYCLVLLLTALAPTVAAGAPERAWATYIGGMASEEVGGNIGYGGLGLDGAGNIFVCGTSGAGSKTLATMGTEQPQPSGNKEAFLLKFSPDGARIWGTFLGGFNDEECLNLAVDAAGNSLVVGYTRSSDGIAEGPVPQSTYKGGGRNGMAVRYDPDGKRVWGTYVGNPGPAFSNHSTSGALSADGYAYVGGYVDGPIPFAFPPGSHSPNHSHKGKDGYLIKLAPDGSLVWGTYYGSEGEDSIHGVAFVGPGLVYAAGSTSSSTGIATVGDTTFGGFSDAFLVRFEASNGQRVWGTYHGGEKNDAAYPIAADANGVYIAGFTYSKTGIATPGAHQTVFGSLAENDTDAMLARFTHDGGLVWATYYGGSGTDYVHGIALDSAGAPTIGGITWSPNAIAAPGALQPAHSGGGTDNYVARFDGSGARLWATYLGGESGEGGTDVAVFADSTVYLLGQTRSLTNISVNALFQPQFGGGLGDAYLVRLVEGLGGACQGPGDCDGGHCSDGVCCDVACGGDDPGDCQACSEAEGAVVDGVCTILGGAAVCRPAASECDVAEQCSGKSPSCPADVFAADDESCDGGMCLAGACVPDMGQGTSDVSTTDVSTTDASTTDVSTTNVGTTNASTTSIGTTDAGTTGTSTNSTSPESPTTADTGPTVTSAASTETSGGPGATSEAATSTGSEPTTSDDSATTGQLEGGGCGCRESEEAPRSAPLAVLLALGLRRRRRREL